MGTPLEATKTAFRPVNSATLLEIVGYVTAGLSDLGVPENEAAITIYKWHTWLRRMNSWMARNESRYLAIVKLSDSQRDVPKSEHFLGTFVSPASQVNNAETAPLGPLLPGDKGTLLNALIRGISKVPEAGKRTETALIRFIEDVDKLAMHLAPSGKLRVDTTGNSQPASEQVTSVPSLLETPVILSVPNPSPFSVPAQAQVPVQVQYLSRPAPATQRMEEGNRQVHVPPVSSVLKYAKGVIEKIKALPKWAQILLIIFALIGLLRNRSDRNVGQTGGRESLNYGPISNFKLPPVDPWV